MSDNINEVRERLTEMANEATPDIDPEQFRESVEAEHELAMCEWRGDQISDEQAAVAHVKRDRLLALIDRWTNVRSSSEHSSEVTAPPGYVLVPVEPTPMMIATFRADNEHGALSWMTHTTLRCADFRSRYAAMLAAAPRID